MRMSSKVFDLDLPSMLRRRRQMFGTVPSDCRAKRIELPLDLREQDLAQALMESGAFEPTIPTLVMWEGGSMYFERAAVERILQSASRLLTTASSRLWMDYVYPSVFDGSSGFPVVNRFSEAMQCLGEPFISGFNDIKATFACCNLVPESDVPSDIFSLENDPVFGLYRFCIA